MSDLEWYLDVGGKQSGPHSAKEIVELVRAGKISATSQVTAARMNGDWVTAQDLIDAYDELYTKPVLAVPIAVESGGSTVPFTTGTTAVPVSDPNFTAPPRPTEQLEKSKIITLNREELERTPDPTEALFQAIQAAREKANQKNPVSPNSPTGGSTAARDSFGQLSRAPASRVPPQLILILTLAAIFGVTVYGVVKLIGAKTAEESTKVPVAKKNPAPEPPPVRQPPSGAALLNDQGGGNNAARTTPPVAPVRNMPNRVMPHGNRIDDRLTKGGGARYRDDRDSPLSDDSDVNETDVEPNREALPEPMPVDPSQVPTDRIIPEAGTIPGRGTAPGTDPYLAPTVPPPGAQQ